MSHSSLICSKRLHQNQATIRNTILALVVWVPDWNAQKIEPGLQRIGQSSRRGRELSKRSRSAWANKSASHLLRQLWIIIGRIIFFAVSTLFKDIRLGKSKGKAFVCPVQKGAGTSPENRNKINYIMFTKACPRDIKKNRQPFVIWCLKIECDLQASRHLNLVLKCAAQWGVKSIYTEKSAANTCRLYYHLVNCFHFKSTSGGTLDGVNVFRSFV